MREQMFENADEKDGVVNIGQPLFSPLSYLSSSVYLIMFAPIFSFICLGMVTSPMEHFPHFPFILLCLHALPYALPLPFLFIRLHDSFMLHYSSFA
jgi:hypothetical protein